MENYMRKWVVALLLVGGLAGLGVANTAVSTYNYFIDGLYGNVNGDTAKALGASAALPVGTNFGLQFDGLTGEINPRDLDGAGLHAFWRDGTRGLVGLTSTYTRLEKTDARRIGVEGELYSNDLTLAGYVGHQTGDIDDSEYAGFQVRYYVGVPLMLSAGVLTADSSDRYDFGVEYQTSVSGLSCYADLATGEGDYDHAFFGLRFYFGGKGKSLIRRHREDNVMPNLFLNLLDTLNSGSRTASSSGSGGSGGGD